MIGWLISGVLLKYSSWSVKKKNWSVTSERLETNFIRLISVFHKWLAFVCFAKYWNTDKEGKSLAIDKSGCFFCLVGVYANILVHTFWLCAKTIKMNKFLFFTIAYQSTWQNCGCNGNEIVLGIKYWRLLWLAIFSLDWTKFLKFFFIKWIILTESQINVPIAFDLKLRLHFLYSAWMTLSCRFQYLPSSTTV